MNPKSFFGEKELGDDLEIPVMLATAEAQSGHKSAAVKMLSDLEKLSKNHYSGEAYWRALPYLRLGNRDEAIHWLEQSVADRAGSDIVFIQVFHFLDPLRGDPRFEALAEKAGVVVAPLTGLIVDRTGQFWWAFVVAAAITLLGGASWVFLTGPLKQVRWPAEVLAGNDLSLGPALTHT